MNKNIPGRTDKQYYNDNKNKIVDYQKEYRESNKVKIKAYYETNKEKLKEKFDCECGGKYTHNHKSHHLKTTKHQNYLETLK